VVEFDEALVYDFSQFTQAPMVQEPEGKRAVGAEKGDQPGHYIRAVRGGL
jgi:hypothetical protein